MMKVRLIPIVLIILNLTSCSKLPDLGDGYRFDYDGKYTLQIVNNENTIMISSTILKYAFDSNFIIASQRPWDSIPGIRNMTYNESKKAFEKSKFCQYWILKKKEKNIYAYDNKKETATYSNVHGPFKKEEYLKKCKELGVPRELKLKEK